MRIVISGTVQGVGFRPSVYRAAMKVGASGTVWNDGSDVVIDTDMGDEVLDTLLNDLPPLARVTGVRRTDDDYTGPKGFSIVRSEEGGRGASIPTDSAVCDRCLEEMLSPGRRSGYPFTTCTDCGPRFTLLRGMPYDRQRTSMDAFPMCPECGREFKDPSDRRFHHQTVCCPACGPEYRLIDGRGARIEGDPIKTLAHMLDDGCIAVVKGWGGMHICCNLDRLAHMREWYGRKEKPFAIMARDMLSLERYASPDGDEKELLLSPHRPIVLVRKKQTPETELASPGLDNIGMFLPYTGMHHMLFAELEHDALVMTSANVPGEPMLIDDDRVMELGADAYLLHDQPILNRADDSVVRMFGGRTQFIRRSRGNVPFSLEAKTGGCAVGLGAQENLAGCVASDGRLWPTQYIGNGEKIGVPEYLEEAIRTQIGFLGCTPQIIAIDLHPGYANRPLAKRLSEEYGAEILQVQHHWAHAASLLADNGKNECVALTLDGTGHGDDGVAWGGEVMYADMGRYERIAHLQEIPLPGGEKALYDLRRLMFGIDYINGIDSHLFTERETDVLKKLIPKSVRTTSMGRILDALSFRLGVCTTRTYDGEPAMKLEPLLSMGGPVEGFETETVNGTVMTADLFTRQFHEDRASDAYSIVRSIMSELVNSAADYAVSHGIKDIGLTGGVSYNRTVSSIFCELVESRGFHPLLHNDVPNGDGGISIGQASIALEKLNG